MNVGGILEWGGIPLMGMPEIQSPLPEQREKSIPGRIFDLFESFFENALDWKLVLVLCATFLGYVYLLPEPERSKVRIADFLSILESDNLWLIVSVVLAILTIILTALGVLVIWALWRRVSYQEQELSRFRSGVIPGRLSSHDVQALVEYPKRSERMNNSEEKP